MAESPRAKVEVFRKDYKSLPFQASHVDMKFELRDDVKSTITCTVQYQRREGREGEDMVLNGETKPAAMKLVSVKLMDKTLTAEDYVLTDDSLTIPSRLLPSSFALEIVTDLDPASNTSLQGLYKSNGIFCTQEEAEGFRNMTYFYDRPDNMATYTVEIIADKIKYPYLLSNGNDIAHKDLDGGLHSVTWEDPWPKPCYLFALVAGDLAVVQDKFTTMSGKNVQLRIFVEHGKDSQTAHAMISLKKAFRWDEEKFGREYDLDQFNIVAVSDFNMGAMENKSLNIFNDRYILADDKTATDTDFSNVEGVVAHEYFHNWTGNRITCRDWFQLTLKEGLTVYRDQEFSSDMGSRPVKRISDVIILRTAQFREDAGPMAHPIRPESYISMDNFYTVTVYDKGADVIRMIALIVGTEGFRKGMDLYFQRHDGQAVTCDDFVAAMEDANGVDLTQFRRWYSQAGTPTLTVSVKYSAEEQQFVMNVSQSCPPTPGQPTKEPFDIPLAMGLIGKQSKKPLELKLLGQDTTCTTQVLRVTEQEQSFVFVDVPEEPVPSLLRNFSAPVKLICKDLSQSDKQFLMAYDTDPFTQWDAGQELAGEILLDMIAGGHPDLRGLIEAFRMILSHPTLDPAFQALALSLPTESYLADRVEAGTADPDAIHEKREEAIRTVVNGVREDLWKTYRSTEHPKPDETFGQASGRRALKNYALQYLCKCADVDSDALQAAITQFRNSDNMTDQMGALSAIVLSCPMDAPGAAEAREECLNAFYEQWKADTLVVLKWLRMKAAAPGMDGAGLATLLQHEAFDLKNPNKVYSIIGGFSSVPTNFHRIDGSGYKAISDLVKQVDPLNPQVASRTAGLFSGWKKFAPESRRLAMQQEMQSILDLPDLSPDTHETVSKSLA